jgi:hypothetical protein
VPFYKERHLSNISLGSLVILCMLRVLTYNVSRARDAYLLSNCSAVLLNLAGQAEKVHEYTALRMTNVLHSILRRYVTKHQAREEKLSGTGDGPPPFFTAPRPAATTGSPRGAPTPGKGGAGHVDYSGVISSVLENSSHHKSPSKSRLGPTGGSGEEKDAATLAILEEALRALLTVFNICLRPSLIQNNLPVVHYLLYYKRELDTYLHHPRIVALGWLGSIPAVMEHFSEVRHGEGGGGEATCVSLYVSIFYM